jgi:hypothetical protein
MRSPTWFTRAAFAAAVVGGLVAAFAPLGQECSMSAGTASGTAQERCVGTSLFQHEGAWILVVVSVPVIVALLPVLVRHQAARVVSTVLLWACVVVAMLSVGLFFLPAAILMTIAAVRRPAPALVG